MSDSPRTPYGQLSLFYFFYFASLGLLVPYWSLYLQSLDFNPREIGELLAILVGTKLIAPYIWGWIADHSGQRIRVVRIGSFLTILFFLPVYEVHSYWVMAAVMVLYSFFWNAVLPQYEAVSMNHLGKEHHRYSIVRSWGSIGFIMTVILIGPLIDEYGPRVILPVLTFIFIAIWLSGLWTPDDKDRADIQVQSDNNITQVVLQPAVLALFTVCFLMQFSHGAYYAFFSIYMEDHGYSKTIIGQYWAIGVLAEVVIFLFITTLINRYGAKLLLVTSLGIAAIRWVLTAYYIDSPLILLLAQIMHAATFGLYHAVAIYYVHHYFTGKLQGRGQALYSSVSFGAGGAIGSIMSGYSWESLGTTSTYLIASAGVFLAVIVALFLLEEVKHT